MKYVFVFHLYEIIGHVINSGFFLMELIQKIIDDCLEFIQPFAIRLIRIGRIEYINKKYNLSQVIIFKYT